MKVKNDGDFIREIKRLIALLTHFGLTLRYIGSEEKWYLVAISDKPPKDLTSTLLDTLFVIYNEVLNGRSPTITVITVQRNINPSTVKKHVEELVEKGYLTQNHEEITLTLKAKKLIKPKEADNFD